LATFYGLVSYTVGITLLMSMAGIRVGRRFFRHRAGRTSAQKERETPQPMDQLALEAHQAVNLVPERRAPRPFTTDEDDVSIQFDDIMMRVLRQNHSNNPFY
jgi:hypothetical protein